MKPKKKYFSAKVAVIFPAGDKLGLKVRDADQ